MSDLNPSASQPPLSRRLRPGPFLLGLSLSALVLGGAAFAANKPASKVKAPAAAASAPASMDEENCPYHDADPHAHMVAMHGMGHPPMGSHWEHGMMLHAPFDAHSIERMLDEVKATDAQRAQIRQVGDKARADLKALHEHMPMDAHAAMGQGGLSELLTQAQVDGAAAEQARQAVISHHDAVSKRMLQATLDIANALTPEQRTALGEAMKQRQMRLMHHMHGHPADPHHPDPHHGMGDMAPATK